MPIVLIAQRFLNDFTANAKENISNKYLANTVFVFAVKTLLNVRHISLKKPQKKS